MFDNPDGRLLPGLYAKVKLGGNAPHDAVLINDRAIGTDQGKKFVLVVDKDNKLNYREVQMGPNYDGLRVIRSGLKAGEVIVVNGLQRVRPGDTVAPTPVRMALKRELERGNATEKSADNQPEQAKKESVG